MNEWRKPQNSTMAKTGIRSHLNTEHLSFCYRNMHSIEQLEQNKRLYTCLSEYKFFKYYIRNNSPPHLILIMWIISLHARASSIHTALTIPLPSISHLELTLNSSFPSLLPAVKTQTTLVTSHSLHAMKWPPSPCQTEWQGHFQNTCCVNKVSMWPTLNIFVAKFLQFFYTHQQWVESHCEFLSAHITSMQGI